MKISTTEQVHASAVGLDQQHPEAALELLLNGQVQAVQAVADAVPQIAAGARILADTLNGGGKLGYVAAGSSALVAFADGLEIPGTFGIANDRIKLMIAGGVESLMDLVGNVEDAGGDGARHVAEKGLGRGDCVIAVSASGSTPYTLGAHHAARKAGARTISITNNRDTELAAGADVAIELATPPEMVGGSTRLGAATAQKVTMNMLSTLMALHLGHVHDGYMVSVRADNQKLLNRAVRMVMDIAACDKAKAEHSLLLAEGSVKEAVLLAAGAGNVADAKALLSSSGHRLRPALESLKALEKPQNSNVPTGT